MTEVSRKGSKRGPRRHPSRKRSNSKTKLAWTKILNNSNSKEILGNSWKQKNPQEYFKKNVRKLLGKK